MSFSSTPRNTSGAVFNNNGYNWQLPTVSAPVHLPPPVAPVAPVNPDDYEQQQQYAAQMAAYNTAKKDYDEGTQHIDLNPRGYVDPGVSEIRVNQNADQIYRPTNPDTSTYDWSTNQDPTKLIRQGSVIPQFDVDAFVKQMLSPQNQAADAQTTPGLFVPQQAMGASK